MARNTTAKKFCKCIKSVRKTVKVRGKNKSASAKESAAIAICTSTMLKRRGKTLKKFSCSPKAVLKTQKMK
jgi:hypothetical protein